MAMRRFKDMFPEETLEGERVSIDDVFGKSILIKAFTILQSYTTDSEFAIIQGEIQKDNKLVTFPCGGKIIVGYLKKVKEMDAFPFITTIKKNEGKEFSYYTFE